MGAGGTLITIVGGYGDAFLSLPSIREVVRRVTVAPLASVINACPPGASRMNAPPPSAARIIARIGVGSAVTVVVGVSVGGRVAGVEEGLSVREAVLAGAARTGVSSSISAVDVIDGMAEGVKVDSPAVISSGLGDASPVCIMTQFAKFV